jgi:hypothetical protein
MEKPLCYNCLSEDYIALLKQAQCPSEALQYSCFMKACTFGLKGEDSFEVLCSAAYDFLIINLLEYEAYKMFGCSLTLHLKVKNLAFLRN